MDNRDALQAEILARLSSLEDNIIDIAKKINIIEGMGVIEKNKKKIEDTKQEILEQLMERQYARYNDPAQRDD